jgi:hypothetical protein
MPRSGNRWKVNPGHNRLAGSVLEVIQVRGHLPQMSAPDRMIQVLAKHLGC